MRIYRRSLRQKVIIGYFVGFALMLGVAFVTWTNLGSVKSMVTSGETVSDILNRALEIRRFEKNYFLYRKSEDYEELLHHINETEKFLEKHEKEFSIYAESETISELRANIDEYTGLLNIIKTSKGLEGNKIWEEKLRTKGKVIVEIAEGIAKKERQIVQKTLNNARTISIVSIILLVSAGFIAGGMFYRMFIKPLGIFEEHMKRITEGEFSLLPTDESHDRELISLSNAFNRMIIELEARQQHLIQSEKLASLGTLLFGVAHEINNPLSNISTSCQILKDEIEDADLDYKKELLTQIEGETDRAKDIVHSLLEFSRTREKDMINLHKTVKEAIRFIRTELPSKIEISVAIPEDITLYADKQRIQQAFLNLVKNSIEAIQEEGKISITAREKIKDKMIEISITDTGIGLEPELFTKVFDPFFTTKGTKKGYGLGLFIVHTIIEEHNGIIRAESNLGRGTTFTILLPTKGAPHESKDKDFNS